MILPKATTGNVLFFAIAIVLFWLFASDVRAQASCHTQPDGSVVCCETQPDGTELCTSSAQSTPAPTITILPWQSPTPTIAPTLTPVDYYQCATAIVRGCALLPIVNR